MAGNVAESFIARWAAASASERANSQLFLAELCDVLEVARPDPHREEGYAFEFPVPQQHRDGSVTQGRIDLYKRRCFVLESKQFHAAQAEPTPLQLAAEEAGALPETKRKAGPVRGTDQWDDAMTKARGQAERYIRSLPQEEPTPPFLIVADVGDTFELYADFTQAGKAYLPFPDPRTFRVRLADLASEKTRATLRAIWTDPFSLDPARQSAAVTREIAGHLAELAKSLEAAGQPAATVAEFLTRCLFCMFAEDVGLLPERGFTELLHEIPDDGAGFEELLRTLFREMNAGTGKSISVVLRKKLLRFNGGLFADDTVLPLNRAQLALLRAASRLDWKSVEPAIFGTLLERALNPHERHKLGAHYTPRAYVERLVLPTVVEPVRADWESVRAAALTHARAGRLKEARAAILGFHKKLCEIKVLDPACGSGNFLYVTLEHLKRLEGEVLDEAAKYGETFKLELEGETVDPHQFLGIEINPRAAAIAELVLWIGYLQWHFRTHGKRTPHEPILRNFHNIECRDAVLAYDGEPEPARDEEGKIKTVWDRRSFKADPVTGRDVPDDTKRIPLLNYANPRAAMWPAAEFIVGNPPFIGDKVLRENLGDGYVQSLRAAYPEIPESADFVLYWWHKAAEVVRTGRAKRFGLITTNSLRQVFSRRVVQAQLTANPPISLIFAIPDHPWVDSADGAAVRISMSVGESGRKPGRLSEVQTEKPAPDSTRTLTFRSQAGRILSNLSIGPDTASASPLASNQSLGSVGIALHAPGLALTSEEADTLMSAARAYGLERVDEFIKPVLNGRDVTQTPRGGYVIDLFGVDEHSLRDLGPIYQWVLQRVRPERAVNKRASYRELWWLPGEPRPELRRATQGIERFIVTPMVAKHRVFQFFPSGYAPDQKLVVIAADDAFILGCLSSQIHLTWALELGSVLEDRPTYSHSTCFLKFPFPYCNEAMRKRIGKLAEELDAHRKRAQTDHGLTLTGMYNVLEKLRAGGPLNAKEKAIHDKGLVSVLRQLHDDLDGAVFDAYGWPRTLSDAEILERLVALNAERAAEEKRGIIHWLRPEYQNPKGARAAAPELKLEPAKGKPPKKSAAGKTTMGKPRKMPWPKTLAERVKAVAEVLRAAPRALSPAEITARFARAQAGEVAEILETLVVMGQARRAKGSGEYSA